MHDKKREIESYKRKKSTLRPTIEWGSDLEWEWDVWDGEKFERIERDWGEMREISRGSYL